MYTLIRSRDFGKSFRRLGNSELRGVIKKELSQIINILASGKSLELKHRDHKLNGIYATYRECHIKNDLLLIYQIRKEDQVLFLADIGSLHIYLSRSKFIEKSR